MAALKDKGNAVFSSADNIRGVIISTEITAVINIFFIIDLFRPDYFLKIQNLFP